MSRWLEDDRTAAEHGEVHARGLLERKSLVRRDMWVSGGRAHSTRRCIVPVDGVVDDVGPVGSRGTAVLTHRGGLLVNRPDGALGDRVQVDGCGREGGSRSCGGTPPHGMP